MKITPQRSLTISSIMLAAGAFVAFLGVTFGDNLFLIIPGIVLLAASVVFHIVFYRCPHCGKFLDRSRGEFCPYCSKEVNKP